MLEDATVAARGPRNVAAVGAGLAGARQNAVVVRAVSDAPPLDRLQRQLAADGERGRCGRCERAAGCRRRADRRIPVLGRRAARLLPAGTAAQAAASASAAASVRDSRRRGAGGGRGPPSSPSGPDAAFEAAGAAGGRRRRRRSQSDARGQGSVGEVP